jgi:DNA repair exonuclease SbcCD ATPase subunit
MATKRPTEKNTKAEILAAFDELLKEKKAIESQARDPKPQVQSKPADPSELRTALNAPSPKTMESIISSLNHLQTIFGSSISELAEKLVLEATKLQEIRQSVDEEIQQLDTLHALQASETDLDQLIQQYGDSFKTYNEELSQQQEALNQEVTQAQKTWSKEQDDHRRAIKERNETLNKNRQRDVKEYTYDLTLQRKLVNEAYEQEQTRLNQTLLEARQTLEKQWAEREKQLCDRELQYSELKAKVEAYPQELETAVKRAKEEGKGIAHYQAKVKADLAAKDIEGQKRTYELRIQALLDSIQNQDARIESLAQQLADALKQVQDLAVKAIEGASNVSSAQVFREIAIEQAKTQAKNK